jgi:hypothetical protein
MLLTVQILNRVYVLLYATFSVTFGYCVCCHLTVNTATIYFTIMLTSFKLQLRSVNSVRFEILTAVVIKSSIFWDISSCSLLKVNRRFGGTCRLHLQGRRISQALLATCFILVYCLDYSSTLKMEAKCSSETSFDIQRTTRRYVPVLILLPIASSIHSVQTHITT